MNKQITWFEKILDRPGWTEVTGTIEQMKRTTPIAPKGISKYILPVTAHILQGIPDDNYILCPVYQMMPRLWQGKLRMSGNDWQIGVTGTGYVSEGFDGIAISRRELGEELGIIPNLDFTYQMAKVTNYISGPRIIFLFKFKY